MNRMMVARELVSMARALLADDDPMAKERVGGLFMKLHTWATEKATSLPPGALVATQILKGLSKVERKLKGKAGLRGREAVRAIIEAMAGDFTVDAPPLRSLWRKYGDEVEQMFREVGIRP